MCGRYFFDLSSNELKSYYDQVAPNATNKHVRIGYNEIFPSNHVVTLALNQESKIVPGITRWGFEGFKKGQLMINARSETVEEKRRFLSISKRHVVYVLCLVFTNGTRRRGKFYSPLKTMISYILVVFIEFIKMVPALRQNQ